MQLKLKPSIIGRESEQLKLLELYNSSSSQFIAIYGRRRVGKTYLVKELLAEHFTFQLSGLANTGTREQLLNFHLSLKRQSSTEYNLVANWLEAFEQLISYIEASPHKRKVIFLDELPWLDTSKSNFIPALEHFWNGWANFRNDIVLIVCGSATSWMIDKLINNHGGLHNRLTYKIKIEPFTLKECEQFFKYKGMEYSRYQIAECYMAMGGIPYYLNLLEKGFSIAQNIDLLFFAQNPRLEGEFKNLYHALFKNSENYIKVVEVLAKKGKGLLRQEIAEITNIPNGGGLTRVLKDLESCGFIRIYPSFNKHQRDSLYQLTDFFTLFYFKFLKTREYNDEAFWANSIDTPQHNAWAGFAFEKLCLAHSSQIKAALGISGIQSIISCWTGSGENNAQIDLVINRKDQIINICEIKYSIGEYSITKQYEQNLRNKIAAFKTGTNTKKAVHLTMITTYGTAQNIYSGIVQSQVTLEQLF